MLCHCPIGKCDDPIQQVDRNMVLPPIFMDDTKGLSLQPKLCVRFGDVQCVKKLNHDTLSFLPCRCEWNFFSALYF